jgi:DNA modification methylase
MAINKSWFVLPNKTRTLKGFKDGHVPASAGLAEKFITEYTKKNAVVFDPFAGFGTTLFAADKLKRVGIGIEYDIKKINYIKPFLKAIHNIIHGDSLKISSYNLPKIDLCFTSPAFMRYFDKENPLSNYTQSESYKEYLLGINKIYSQIKKLTKKGGNVVLDVSDTFDKNHPMTTLAWDVGKIISKHFYFERDFIFCSKNLTLASTSANDNHTYCLMFRN